MRPSARGQIAISRRQRQQTWSGCKASFARIRPGALAANHHEVRLVQLCFDFYMIEAKLENLIGDRAYESDPLDAELRKEASR